MNLLEKVQFIPWMMQQYFDEWMIDNFDSEVDISKLIPVFKEQFKDDIEEIYMLVDRYESGVDKFGEIDVFGYEKTLDADITRWADGMRDSIERKFFSVIEGMLNLLKEKNAYDEQVESIKISAGQMRQYWVAVQACKTVKKSNGSKQYRRKCVWSAIASFMLVASLAHPTYAQINPQSQPEIQGIEVDAEARERECAPKFASAPVMGRDFDRQLGRLLSDTPGTQGVAVAINPVAPFMRDAAPPALVT